MKKALIIGGAGYIGGYTTDILLYSGYEVCVYDKLIYETRYLKKVKFVYGDIRETTKILNLAKEYDVIVLMAALVGDEACKVNKTLTESINYTAVKDICTGLRDSKHIIFLSTCSVYGDQEGLLNEESNARPLSAYAETKWGAERYIKASLGTIFRLGTVYGIGDTHSRIRLDLVVNYLTMKAVFENNIHIYGGEQYRPLICVRDVAGYIMEAIGSDIRGTFILSKNNMTMNELSQKIVDYYPGLNIEFSRETVKDPRNYRVSTKKADETFTYKPKITIEHEISYMASLFRENRIKNVDSFEYNNGKYINEYIKLIQ
jgi:nucleoside-diphosphate-sugar epimerase